MVENEAIRDEDDVADAPDVTGRREMLDDRLDGSIDENAERLKRDEDGRR
jgi:hypothetical protein